MSAPEIDLDREATAWDIYRAAFEAWMEEMWPWIIAGCPRGEKPSEDALLRAESDWYKSIGLEVSA